MKKFYVTGKIEFLDIGAEIEAENPYMAAVEFIDCYKYSLKFNSYKIKVLEVKEVTYD